ncbi:MAG: hypothetical protein CMC78_03980 [Flavobacteriaceae bacterium]|nr:hypothetical protein [Flavobacteriaceae bacterium]
MTLFNFLILFSSVSFFFYGLSSFFNSFMIDEFIRYRIPQFRKLTGWFQLLGSLGIIIGFWIDNLQALSTICLSLMMLFGVAVRIKIKDNLIKILPAVFYCLLNAYLSFKLIF